MNECWIWQFCKCIIFSLPATWVYLNTRAYMYHSIVTGYKYSVFPCNSVHGWTITSIPSMRSVLKPVKLPIKEIIHPKRNICGKFTFPQAILDEYVSSHEQIWRNWTWHHFLSNGYTAVNGCRQNESSNSWHYVKHNKNTLQTVTLTKL